MLVKKVQYLIENLHFYICIRIRLYFINNEFYNKHFISNQLNS